MREPRLFFGNRTVEVHVSHDWGALFCFICGAWPGDPKADRRCPGPPWLRVPSIDRRLWATDGAET